MISVKNQIERVAYVLHQYCVFVAVGVYMGSMKTNQTELKQASLIT